MIITDNFVVLNFPKTGSTFVRRVLKHLYDTRASNLTLLERIARRTGLRKRPLFEEVFLPLLDQHGTYSHIPPEHRHKRIVSVVRNPFDRFISQYHFRWWADHPDQFFHPEIVASFPAFPDLSIDEFARIRQMQIERDGFEISIGPQTIAFIRMFFREPDEVLRHIDDTYLESDAFLKDMPSIMLLRTEHLSDDLTAFLLEQGFSAGELQFIADHERVNAGPRPTPASELWRADLVSRLKHEERLLFRILAHHGLHYTQPADFI